MKTSAMIIALAIVTNAVAVAAEPIAPGSAEILETNLFDVMGTDADGHVRLQLDPTAIQRLSQSNALHHINLPIALDQSVTASMSRFEVLTPESRFYRATKSGTQEMPAPEVLFLRGQIHGESGSHVFISLVGDAGSGFITRANGTQLELAADRTTGRASGLVVRKRHPGVPGFDAACGVLDAPAEPSALAGAPGADEVTRLRIISVAVDADQSYSQLFQSDEDALAYIAQVIGAVSDIYRRDLNFKLVLNFARIWPEGGEPFDANNLGGFRNYWLQNEDLTGLNLVHMFSGRRNLGYGGIAYLADACNTFGFAISGFLNGSYPAPVDLPDLGNWDVNVIAHEMGHNLGAPHTHSLLPPVDSCATGSDQRGTIMSYCHIRPGGLLNIDMRLHVQNQIGIIADNPAGNCLPFDCNDNGIDDQLELSSGFSEDVNLNGIPDECDDCDGDGIFNDAEIQAGAADLNSNGIPDSCETDCNANNKPDRFECITNPSLDLNGNRIPDECEADCDGNLVADHIDIANATYIDLDRDSGPDVCQDCDGDGIVDWIEVDRQFNFYLGQMAGPVREYHAASAVPIQNLGPSTAYDVVIGADRQVYVAVFGGNKIVRIDPQSGAVADFVPAGSGGLVRPAALAFGPDGHLYVAAHGSLSVLKYNGQSGAFLGTFVVPGSGSLNTPWDLVFRANGNLLVTSSNNRVIEYDGASGHFLSIFIDSATLNDPRGIVMLPSGEWLVVSRGGHRVNRYSSTGAYIGQFNDEFQLSSPWGIMLGPNGNVYTGTGTTSARLIEHDVNTGRYVRSFVRGDTLANPTQFAFMPQSPNDLDGNNVPDNCDAFPCKADIAPFGEPDGVVNVDDLQLIISTWGPCPDCVSDIAPALTGGDNLVNVDDLLEVLNAWGPCES